MIKEPIIIHKTSLGLMPGSVPSTLEKLPVDVYTLTCTETQSGLVFSLTSHPGLGLPKRVYGDPTPRLKGILKTYLARNPRSMGVLLSGKKGSGKTVDAKLLAKMAMEENMPVICVDRRFSGGLFVRFIVQLGENIKCMFLIDEFEKIFTGKIPKEERDGTEETNVNTSTDFLALLDGLAPNPHLFVLTSNAGDIGAYLKDRPGRVRFHVKYDRLPENIVKEVIDDLLEFQEYRSDLERVVVELGANVTMDVLTAIIEEINIRSCSPKEFMPIFNASSDMDGLYTASGKLRDWKVRTAPNESVHDATMRFLCKVVLDPAGTKIHELHEALSNTSFNSPDTNDLFTMLDSMGELLEPTTTKVERIFGERVFSRSGDGSIAFECEYMRNADARSELEDSYANGYSVSGSSRVRQSSGDSMDGTLANRLFTSRIRRAKQELSLAEEITGNRKPGLHLLVANAKKKKRDTELPEDTQSLLDRLLSDDTPCDPDDMARLADLAGTFTIPLAGPLLKLAESVAYDGAKLPENEESCDGLTTLLLYALSNAIRSLVRNGSMRSFIGNALQGLPVLFGDERRVALRWNAGEYTLETGRPMVLKHIIGGHVVELVPDLKQTRRTSL